MGMEAGPGTKGNAPLRQRERGDGVNITIDKPLPAAVEAERSLLGSILLEGDRLVEIRGQVHASVFSLEAHRLIYQAMCSLDDQSLGIDITTLVQELKDRKHREAVGGASTWLP